MYTPSPSGAVILRLEYGQTCFLFLNSVGTDAQRALLAEQPGAQCDVLQVGGREDALHLALVDAVQPALIVKSGTNDERLEDGAAVLVRTSVVGNIGIVSDGIAYSVRTER